MSKRKKKSIYRVVEKLKKKLASDFYYAILKCDDLLTLTRLNNMIIRE